MLSFELPIGARILSTTETLNKTGSTEPCYQIYRTDGAPIVGGIYPLRPKKNIQLQKITTSSRSNETNENENNPWISVYSATEKYEARRIRKIYQTLQIRDD